MTISKRERLLAEEIALQNLRIEAFIRHIKTLNAIIQELKNRELARKGNSQLVAPEESLQV